MYVAFFVVVLITAIMIHEFGHFITAKAFGMKAERFFLGFGPTLWSTRRGETEYGIKAIPAGGFVKIAGMNSYEEIAEADRPRAFFNHPAWQRVIVLAAGSATHFVIAGVLIVVALGFFTVPTLVEGQATPVAVVGQVEPGSPAEAAGLAEGDRILSIDGEPTANWAELVGIVAERGGETVAIEVERAGQVAGLTATVAATAPDGERRGFLGIGYEPELAYTDPSLGDAVRGVFVGEYSVWTQTRRTVEGLVSAFSPSSLAAWVQQADGDRPRSAEGPISLVGAGQAVGALGNLGEFSSILLLLAQLNIVIGLLNMLPLPPLDGGHLAVLGIERGVNAVRGRTGRSTDWELSPSVVTPVALTVLLLLTGFALTAFYIDIVNPVSGLFD